MRIIDSKKIDISNDEFDMYENICKAYPSGKDLFRDLFETDDDGIIICLKPPKKQFSMEIVIFLQNIMVHQHLRRIYNDHNEALKEFSLKNKELIDEIQSLKDKISEFEKMQIAK